MAGLKPLEAQRALDMLEKHLLGDDYYIADPVNNAQGNAIVVDDIISRYKGPTESPANKWRRRHKKCMFCKHCSQGRCSVKMKRIDERIPRHFCSAFQLKPYCDNCIYTGNNANSTNDGRISVDDAIKAINNFAKYAYEHKMGL